MGDDFQDKFRAAKAARAASKPTKDQIKALKAQKAQAAASAAPPAAALSNHDEDTKSMPPPPPRPTPGPSSKPNAATTPPVLPGSYHADSQATRLQDGVAGSGLLHSEPSVNKIPAPAGQPEVAAHPSQPAAANATSLAESNAIPSGLLDAVVAQGQGSTTGISLGAGIRAAKSAEGSTGAMNDLDYGELRSGSAHPADLATSQLSAMPAMETAAISRAYPDVQVEESMREAASGPAGQGNTLPKGFFDKETPATAAGSGPARQTTKVSAVGGVDMDKEYADFLKEVDAAAEEAVPGVEAGPGEEDDEPKRQREDFEQFVRMERLREVREAAAKREGTVKSSDDEFVTAPETHVGSALEIAGLTAEVPPPKFVLPKKRKVSETLAMLEAGESDDEEEEDEGDGMLDWRAKKSNLS